MSINSDNSNVVSNVIYSALPSFSFSYLGKSMTLSPDLPTFDPTRVSVMLAQDPVTGVNGIYTSASESATVIGTTYQFSAEVAINNRALPPWRFEATAATTSFTDLADQFVLQINAANASSTNPLPATAVNTGGHIVVTEAPFINYGVGECKVNLQLIRTTTGITENAWTISTANVQPVGNYEALQRIYLASTGQATSNISGTYTGSGWLGTATPTSGHTYTTLTLVYSPIDKPNNDAAAYLTFKVYVDNTLAATSLSYAKSTFQEFSAQAGVSSGNAAQVVPITTTASGIGLIPNGATSVYVTSTNSAFFVALPVNYPVGKLLKISNNSTGYKLIMGTLESINGGPPGVGSSVIPASVTLIAQKISTTAWMIFAQLGSGVPTAVPANS